MEKYKILKDLVGFNTIKDKENKEIIDYLEKYLLSLGFKTEYKEKALIMSIGNNPKLGFLGHTDTVDYAKDKWKKEPFKLTIEDGNIYGLGVCDMKGGIAAMLEAVTELKKELNLKLYFTYAEETTFEGMYDVLENEKEFPEIMIFGEPTNNEILVGSKGILELELKFIGKSAHSSTPDKGISANMNAIKFINELDEFYQKEIKEDINELLQEMQQLNIKEIITTIAIIHPVITIIFLINAILLALPYKLILPFTTITYSTNIIPQKNAKKGLTFWRFLV